MSGEERVGVFVCHCGGNISDTVDVKAVVEAAKQHPSVVHAEDYMYMCSEIGQQLIRKAIEEKKLTSVVVAACSPTLHEETFAQVLESAGLNRYKLEIANIRELCSLVHDDVEKATEKAKRIVLATIEKVIRNEPLEMMKAPAVKKCLVIGGGIAGIQASLDLSNAGIPVILVEKSPSIGGRMAQLSKTFPTLDCAQCILTPRMAEVARKRNVKILTCSEVVSVEGRVGDFKVKILKRARKVDPEKCRLCGKCAEVCPVTVPNEFDRGLTKRKAIYLPFEQAIPSAYVIDTEHCVRCGRCASVCPFGAINLDEQDEIIEENVGAIIVATGYDLYPGEKLSEYGYGKYQDVIDSLQFERLFKLSIGKPLTRPSDGRPVKRIVFVQCAGSRDDNHLPYCSKICCMYIAKQALLFKEKVPDGEAYVFYIDVRAAGKGYEEFVRRVQEEYGVVYIRGKVSKVYRDPDGSVVVVGVDTLSGEKTVVKADLVVLALGMVPSISRELASMLKIPLDEYGFVQEVHPKLRPVECSTSGVFVCGVAQGPKDISETVAQASAAAGKVMDLLVPGQIVREPLVASIDEDLCSLCRACISVCPYGAIVVEEGKIKVDEVLCEGCGACVVACPCGAITLKNQTNEQLIAMVSAYLR